MKRESERIYIRPLKLTDTESLLQMRLRNREFVRLFEPIQKESHFTYEGQREIIEGVITNWEQGSGFGFGIFLKATEELIGRVNLSNVVRGAWDSCTIGYFLDELQNGKGLTTQAVHLAVQYAFEEADLHRVQAGVMPRNKGSIRVLEKSGFQFEGLAKFYLRINGKWEDHNIYSITQEFWG